MHWIGREKVIESRLNHLATMRRDIENLKSVKNIDAARGRGRMRSVKMTLVAVVAQGRGHMKRDEGVDPMNETIEGEYVYIKK